MKTGVVGAGKVGYTLGKYFKEHGVDVSGYYSRSPNSAKEAAVFTDTKSFETLEQILTESDILFLTVPDSAIKIVWEQLKILPVEIIKNKIICHCSGVMSSEIFDGIEEKGAYGYSVHPLYAISSKLNSYKEISQALFTIEGIEEVEGKRTHLNTVKQFIESLGNSAHIITAQQKIKYHAAAVFLSNHAAAVAYTGSKLLRDCGFEEEFVEIALKTLFLNHCKAIAENGAVKSLTGAVERNDLSTVKKHIDCLAEDEKNLYILLSKQLIQVSKEKHGDYDYSDMESLLKNEIINNENRMGKLN